MTMLSYDRSRVEQAKREQGEDQSEQGKRFILYLFIGVALALTIFLLTGCSKKSVELPTEKGAVDISSSLDKCYIHKDYIACSLNGQTYFATMEKINQITTWDKTMWKNDT